MWQNNKFFIYSGGNRNSGTSAYAASKAGLWGMTRSMAVENASKGITINNLNLGYFNIGMINEVSEEYQQIVKKKIPTVNSRSRKYI
ncbi:MAG: SDR family NAD(P)-dependent oxidoreductase [Ignavibacteria bacterium]